MATVSKATATRSIEVLRSRPGVRVSGGPYMDMVGASLISYNAGTRSVNQKPTFRGPAISVGAKSVESVSFDLGAALPHLKYMVELEKADQQRLPISVRHDFYGHSLLEQTGAGITAAVAATLTTGTDPTKGGKVTFAGTNDVQNMFLNDEILVGDLLQIGGTALSNTYIVNYVEYDEDSPKDATEIGVYVTEADGSNPSADVSADTYSLRVAGLRVEFGGQVEQFGSINGDASGSPSLDSGVVFRPNSAILNQSLLLTDESGSGW